MSVIIRLQNLPWTASALDIRSYFEGLSIPEGGVRILGGEIGDAFILFSTDEDARLAMLKDRGMLGGVQIRLFLSSRTEMLKVFEDMRLARTKPTQTIKKAESINYEEYKIQAGIPEESIPTSTMSPPASYSPAISQNVSTTTKMPDKAQQQKSSTNTLNKYELSLLNDIDHVDQASAEYSPMTPSISYAEYKKRTRERSRSPRAHNDSDCRDQYKSREHERESNNSYEIAKEIKPKVEKALTEPSTGAALQDNDNVRETINGLPNSNWLLTLMKSINTQKLGYDVNKLPIHELMEKEKSDSSSSLHEIKKKPAIVHDYNNGMPVVEVVEDSSNDEDDDCVIVKATKPPAPPTHKNYMNNVMNGSVPLSIAQQNKQIRYSLPPPNIDAPAFLTKHFPYNGTAVFPNKIDTTIPPPTVNTFSHPHIHQNIVPTIIPMPQQPLMLQQQPIMQQSSRLQQLSMPTTTTTKPRHTIDSNQLKCIEMALSTNARITDIKNIFEDISIPVHGIKIQYNKNKKSRGGVVCYAYVKFLTAADAQKALLKNYTVLHKKPIYIKLISEDKFKEFHGVKRTTTETEISPTSLSTRKPYHNKNEKAPEFNVLCVENLTALTEKLKIKAMFAAHGEYDVIMAEQFGSHGSIGFCAFLKFKSEIAAKSALADFSAHALNGQLVKVRVSSAEEAIASKKAELLAHEKLTRDQQALLNGIDSSSHLTASINNNDNDIIKNKDIIINNKVNNANKEDNFIILKNVIYTTTTSDVHRMLMVAGFPPNQIELLYTDTNRPKGEIIVEFSDAVTAKSAVKDLHNKPFRGRTMRVYSITAQQVADITQKPCYSYLPQQNFVDI